MIRNLVLIVFLFFSVASFAQFSGNPDGSGTIRPSQDLKEQET